jgi:hypothetical protein
VAVLQVRELGRGCFGAVWLARWNGVQVRHLRDPSQAIFLCSK